MANFIYCSACGHKSLVHRKALPNFGRIIDITEPHVCTEEIQELDLKPMEVPTQTIKGENNKFVDKINELKPKTKDIFEPTGDKRSKEFIKSSAPESIISNIRSLQNITPSRDVKDFSLDSDEMENI